MTDSTVLINGRVLTCSGDTAERPQPAEVLIDGERIVRVSPQHSGMDRGAARVVDLQGATVLPGLGDAHTHISWTLDFVFDHAALAAAPPAQHALDVAAVARTFLESGYTMIIGAGVSQPQDDVLTKAAIDRGWIPGPRIIPSGTMVTAPGCLGAEGGMMQVAADARELREIVARQCDAGVRAVKLFVSGDGIIDGFPSEDVYMNVGMLEAAVKEADRHRAFITVHARGAASVAMSARAGVRVIHHACFLDDESLQELEARRSDIWVCPGLHYLWAVANGHAEPWGLTPERLESSGYRRELLSQIESIKAMAASGIQLVAGGDFGHQWTRHGTYAAELQRYVEQCGLSPTAAIHAATRNFATLMGIDVGAVREGALADLLIVDGDPTADITLLQQAERRRAVLKGGRFVYVNPRLYP